MSQVAPSYAPVKVKSAHGSEIEFRPITLGDLDSACEFYEAMPEQDRHYLRFDVTQRSEVERRIGLNEEWGKLRRLVALEEGCIVATGVIELHDAGWMKHIAEMRLIVGREHRQKGLGRMMAAELFKIAAQEKVEEIIVQMMLPQEAAYGIFKRLGFRDEIVLKKQVRDLTGELQDLRIMRCALKTLWLEMQNFVEHFDLQRHR
jgi:RimJ/RimL family protein N-acetyltransferase